MTDPNTSGTVESWSTFRRGDDTFMLCYLVQRGQVLGSRHNLRTLGPVTYLDRDSGLCQVDGHLYRLGACEDRSRSMCERLSAQITG
jgi:hypothetical protein